MSKLVRTTVEMIPVSVVFVVGLTACLGLTLIHEIGDIASISAVASHDPSLLAQSGPNGEGSRRPGTGLDR
jgi:hypothetical protein